MNDYNPEEAAQASITPGAFSFMDRLLGRNYPVSVVKVYLDEQSAFERTRLALKAEAYKVRNAQANVELEKQIEEIDKRLQEAKYEIHLQGFPPEEYDKLIDEVNEQYPPEYEENLNPISGERIKKEIPNEDRMNLLHAKLWAKSIKRVVAPTGEVDEIAMDAGTAARMRENFLIDGRRKIDTRIQEMRLGSAWMDQVQDESFLATP